MTAIVATSRKNANSNSAQRCGRSRTVVRLIDSVMQKLHELYPVGTSANIAALARVGIRAVDYWRTTVEAERREMGAEAFINLLTSEDGGEVLTAIMQAIPEGQRPRWWRRHATTARLSAAEHAVAAAEAEVRRLRMDMSK